MNRFENFFDYLFHYDLNIWSTVKFNLKVFGLKKGVRMPVFLFGKIDLQNYHKNCVELSSYKTCSVRIGGGNKCYVHGRRALYPSVINIKGKVVFGNHVTLCNGVVLGVGEKGCLKMGDWCFVNINTRIYCENQITMEEYARASWDVQIFDTNFHYTDKNGMIYPKNMPLHIGHHVWIGNRVTITKGAKVPAHCVVSAYSLVNKDFSNLEEKSLIGGIPAKYITSGIERIFDYGFEFWLDSYFEVNPQKEEYDKLIKLYHGDIIE